MADAVWTSPAKGSGDSGAAAPTRRRVPGALSFGLALVVLAVALAIGGGVVSSGRQTDAQRATALESDIRCPSCDDLSVAQSAASSAVAVRHEISRLVASGETDGQIEAALVDQYGSSILLRPPVSGLSALVWFVPAVAGAAAVAVVAVLFWRRSRALRRLREEPRVTDGTDAGVVVDAGAEWRLRDHQEFLRRSLDDAVREHDAGDLSDDDYRLLHRRDERRLAEVEAALAALETAALETAPLDTAALGTAPRGAPSGGGSYVGEAGPSGAGEGGGASPSAPAAGGAHNGRVVRAVARRVGGAQRRRRRLLLVVGGVACLAAATVVLVVELTSPRLPGEDATGSIDLNTAQEVERQLSQAQTLADGGKPSQALQLYGDVLTEDPKDPVALAEWGWLDWQAATEAKEATVAAEGASAEVEAVRLDKGLFAAQYYLGTILYQEGDASKAVIHYAAFLADHPTTSWLDHAAPTIREAYAAAGAPVPAGVPAASSAASP